MKTESGLKHKKSLTPLTLKAIIIFLFCIYSVSISAQNYPVHHYTMQDGLPSLTIQSIFKDSRGLLWIGTQTGLCTFDGEKFTILGKPEGLSSTNIWSITEDKHGNIWLGSIDDGVIKYDGRTFTNYTASNGLADNKVRVVDYSEKYDCIVAGTYAGFSKITEDTIINFPETKKQRDDFSLVTGIADMGDFMYITTFGPENPIRFYPESNTYADSLNSQFDSLYPIHSSSVYLTSTGDTVFSNQFTGVQIRKQTGEVIENNSMGQVFGITEDNQKNLWFASWSNTGRKMIEGVFKYDGKSFKNYKERFGITDKEIWTVFYDKEQDVLWIGTFNEGLFKVTFSGVEIYPSSYFGLNDQKINDVFIDSDNQIWLATQNELIRMQQDGTYVFADNYPRLSGYLDFWNNMKRTIVYVPENDSVMNRAKTLSQNQLNRYEKQIDFNYRHIEQDSNKSIFYTNRFGLFQLNQNNFKKHYRGPEGLADGMFALTGKDTVLFYGQGQTIINTAIGNDSKQIVDSLIMMFNENSEPINVSQIIQKNNQTWYVSKSSGLWMSEGMNLYKIYDTDSLVSTELNAICFDANDNLIVGSNTGEVFIGENINEVLKIKNTITKENGLTGNSISWLFADEKNRLWVGTNLGINILDLDTLYMKGKYNIRFMNQEEGYLSLTAKKAVPDKSGNLWFADDSKVIKLNREQFLNQSTNSGQLVLTDLEINYRSAADQIGQQLNPWTNQSNNPITLEYNKNNLAFYFNVLNFKNPDKDQYSYFLEGFDYGWSNWESSGKVVYSNLSPGEYTLRVKSINQQTLSESVPLIIRFIIFPPWWELWYVLLISLLLFLMGITISIRLYIKRTTQKREQKQHIEKTIADLEMKALQAQMNPHFIFNTINGIQFYILDNRTDEVIDYLADFSKVVRITLEQVAQKWISLNEEIDFLRSYLRLEQMRFPDKFDFEITSAIPLDQPTLQIPPLMIQPFIENSIRHGFNGLRNKGQLHILFEMLENDCLKCTVSDNGIGRLNAKQNEDFVLTKTRQRSGSVTASRIRFFNTADEPEKFKVIYIDPVDSKVPGLIVQLYLPVKNG